MAYPLVRTHDKPFRRGLRAIDVERMRKPRVTVTSGLVGGRWGAPLHQDEIEQGRLLRRPTKLVNVRCDLWWQHIKDPEGIGLPDKGFLLTVPHAQHASAVAEWEQAGISVGVMRDVDMGPRHGLPFPHFNLGEPQPVTYLSCDMDGTQHEANRWAYALDIRQECVRDWIVEQVQIQLRLAGADALALTWKWDWWSGARRFGPEDWGKGRKGPLTVPQHEGWRAEIEEGFRLLHSALWKADIDIYVVVQAKGMGSHPWHGWVNGIKTLEQRLVLLAPYKGLL